jgi:hypothetical protein
MEGHSFLRAFEIKKYIMRYVKMPCMQVSLSREAPLGNLEGICLLELFKDKGKYIWVRSWTQRTLRFKVWGPCGTLVKGQSSPELISDYGKQRACL